MSEERIVLSAEEFVALARELEPFDLPEEGQPTNRPSGIGFDPTKTAKIVQDRIARNGIGASEEITVKPTLHQLEDGRYAVRAAIPGLPEFEFVAKTPEEAWDGTKDWFARLVDGSNHVNRRAEFEYAVRTRKVS